MSATENNIEKSKSESGENERFDLNLVHKSFSKCCEDTNALAMDHYLIGFKELYR